MKPTNNHINYIKFKAHYLEKTKLFYNLVFDWSFTDYGPTYSSFTHSGVQGGFEKREDEIVNGLLAVIYHQNIEAIKVKVIKAGGNTCKDIFTLPGVRRFPFSYPSGNKIALWADK
jgi:predicted enzyme related to lactoylglutathione lyase